MVYYYHAFREKLRLNAFSCHSTMKHIFKKNGKQVDKILKSLSAKEKIGINYQHYKGKDRRIYLRYVHYYIYFFGVRNIGESIKRLKLFLKNYFSSYGWNIFLISRIYISVWKIKIKIETTGISFLISQMFNQYL